MSMTAQELHYLKMQAEEKDIRAIIQRDFLASLMNATKWGETFQALTGMNCQTWLKFVDVDRALAGFLWKVNDQYSDGTFGPVLTLSLEWLDIDPVEEVHAFQLSESERIDHTAEILARLKAIGVEPVWQGPYLRIIGHLRKPGKTTGE